MMEMKATGTSWSQGPMYPKVLGCRANQVPAQAHPQVPSIHSIGPLLGETVL